MDYLDSYCYSNIPGTDVPLDHMDYGYVNSCTDIKELGQILKILRSGKEGHYPELITCTEKRLSELDPSNKLLIKNKPATQMADLPQEELETLNKDLENWTESVGKEAESSDQQEDESSLPPIRKHTVIDQTNTMPGSQTTPTETKETRIKSQDYDGWSKFDVEKEATKVDKKPQLPTAPTDKPDIPSQLSEKERGLPDAEKELKANKEREKGNEAFRAGDYEEAFTYYTRSVNFNPSVAAFNNRAITELKLKRYENAVTDCSQALKMEPSNTKALFRRGTAYSHLNKPHQAATDFERVLHFEPNNKKAQQELNNVRKKLSEIGGQKDEKKTGRRIQIDEVEEAAVPHQTDSRPTTSEPPPTNMTTPTNNAVPHPTRPATPPPARPDPPPLPGHVQALKDEGNKLFRAGQYTESLDKYTRAIKLLQAKGKLHETNVSMLLSNRAACQLKIGHCQACIADCTQSLALSVLNVKAFMRRAKAYEHLEKYKQAYNDYQMALRIDRSLTPAYEASSRITRLLREQEGNAWRNRLPVCPEELRVKHELLKASLQSAESAKSTEDSPRPLDSADSANSTQQESQDSPVQPVAMETVDTDSKEQSAESAAPPEANTSPKAEASPETLEVTSDPSETTAVPSEVTSEPSEVTSEPSEVTSEPSEVTSEPSEVTSEPSPVATEPAISVTSPVAQTKVTQSTQSVPSPRTATPPSPKVKEDLLSAEEKFDKHKLKGNEHMKKGEYVEALRYYNMCVSVSPGNVVGYTNRALCHLKLNSPRSAEDDSNKALSIDPGNVKALYRRGLARKALRRYSEAVKDLHLLLTIDPDNAPAKRELGEAKQLWEKQLREIQANASSKDTRPERRNPKSKAGKKSRENAQKPPSKDGPQKPPPTKEELEKFQKLLQELEASKEKIEQLSKMAPPGTSWGSQEGGVGDLPFTGPPQATQGKVPNGGRKQPSGKASGGKTPSGTGKSPGKPKKKVPKKTPKVTTKQEKPVPSDTAGSEVKGQSPPTSKGKRIEIEEIHSSDDESPEVVTPPTPEVTTPPTPEDPTPPTPDVTTPLVVDDTAGVKTESDQDRGSPPTLRTPFEFVQQWNAIPRTAKSSEYARLLEAIPPSTLPSVITNKLDGMMLTNIIRAVDKRFIPKGKYELSVEILTSLSKVPRFGMVAMFMGPQEKSDLNNVLTALSTSDQVATETITTIKQQYGL